MGALIGGGIATFLSLCVLSRAVADNPFYRFAQTVLVATALGYIAAVLTRTILVPPIEAAATGQATLEQLIVSGIGLLLGLLLLPRFGRQRGSFWANFPLAVLFGVGAALALVGAVRGTILPQLLDTARMGGFAGDLAAQIGAGVLAALTLVTLLVFTYALPAASAGAGEGRSRRGFRAFGRTLILLTFGVFFAATVTTYIAALVGQVAAMSDWFGLLFGF